MLVRMIRGASARGGQLADTPLQRRDEPIGPAPRDGDSSGGAWATIPCPLEGVAALPLESPPGEFSASLPRGTADDVDDNAAAAAAAAAAAEKPLCEACARCPGCEEAAAAREEQQAEHAAELKRMRAVVAAVQGAASELQRTVRRICSAHQLRALDAAAAAPAGPVAATLEAAARSGALSEPPEAQIVHHTGERVGGGTTPRNASPPPLLTLAGTTHAERRCHSQSQHHHHHRHAAVGAVVDRGAPRLLPQPAATVAPRTATATTTRGGTLAGSLWPGRSRSTPSAAPRPVSAAAAATRVLPQWGDTNSCGDSPASGRSHSSFCGGSTPFLPSPPLPPADPLGTCGGNCLAGETVDPFEDVGAAAAECFHEKEDEVEEAAAPLLHIRRPSAEDVPAIFSSFTPVPGSTGTCIAPAGVSPVEVSYPTSFAESAAPPHRFNGNGNDNSYFSSNAGSALSSHNRHDHDHDHDHEDEDAESGVGGHAIVVSERNQGLQQRRFSTTMGLHCENCLHCRRGAPQLLSPMQLALHELLDAVDRFQQRTAQVTGVHSPNPRKASSNSTTTAVANGEGVGALPTATITAALSPNPSPLQITSPRLGAGSDRPPLHTGSFVASSAGLQRGGPASMGCVVASQQQQQQRLLVSPLPFGHITSRSSSLGSLASIKQQPAPSFTSSLRIAKDDVGNKQINDYCVLLELGRGAQGKVKLVAHKDTGQLFALKIVNKSALKRRGALRATQIHSEIAVMKMLRHRNCVRMFEVIDDPGANKTYMVMQYCAQGPLVATKPDGTCQRLPELLAASATRQIVRGLQYLHRHAILHCDLKLENILCDDDGTVVLTDFGVSEFLSGDGDGDGEGDGDGDGDGGAASPTMPMAARSAGKEDAATSGARAVRGVRRSTTKGTIAYFAPEMTPRPLADDTPPVDGFAADVWALGIVLFALLFGFLPFRGVAPEIFEDIRSQPLPIPPDALAAGDVSASALEVLHGLLERDPSRRMTLRRLRAHQWFDQCAASGDGESESMAASPLASINERALPSLQWLSPPPGSPLRARPPAPALVAGDAGGADPTDSPRAENAAATLPLIAACAGGGGGGNGAQAQTAASARTSRTSRLVAAGPVLPSTSVSASLG